MKIQNNVDEKVIRTPEGSKWVAVRMIGDGTARIDGQTWVVRDDDGFMISDPNGLPVIEILSDDLYVQVMSREAA